MRWLVKFCRLDGADRRLLLEAAVTVLGVRLALWALPLGRLRRLANRHGSAATKRGGQVDPERLAWAVAAAARRVPAASCLTQALALHLLCQRSGVATQLQIGVTRDPGGVFRAHAWVERNGKVLIGNFWELGAFAPLPSVGL